MGPDSSKSLLAVGHKNRYKKCDHTDDDPIGVLQIKQGDIVDGMTALQEALLLAQEMDSKFEVAVVLSWLDEAAKYIGNHMRAVHLYWAAKNVFNSIGAWGPNEDESVLWSGPSRTRFKSQIDL